jgi:hypothetical protein
MNQRPLYVNKDSTQTLREGLQEYYALNPHVTPPETQPPEFAKILMAHDVGHVIYGCDTGMYDELRILPLFWWTSECTFQQFRQMRQNNASVIDVMYDDMIRDRGALWLYLNILKVLPLLIPDLVALWFKTRDRNGITFIARKYRVPFLEFDPLLDRTLLDIRQEYNLLPLFK